MKHTRRIASVRPMSDRSERLNTAMREASITAEQAVERWGWNAHTLASNMQGKIDFGPKKAKEYGAGLRVRHEWLYFGTGAMRDEPKPREPRITSIPVISWVSAGRPEEVPEDEINEAYRLSVSDLPAGEYFATEVRGDSMDRVSPEGSRIIVRSDDRNLVAGQFYLFSVKGETTYKRYQPRPVIRLEPHSTNPAHQSLFLNDGISWSVVGRVYRSMIDLV